jgi:hypothetical protein
MMKDAAEGAQPLRGRPKMSETCGFWGPPAARWEQHALLFRGVIQQFSGLMTTSDAPQGRNVAGPKCDGSTLGCIIKSLEDWQFDKAGHQREMSLCEIMEYARVNPVRAIAPRTRRFSTGNGSPMTNSNGVK